MDQGTIDRLTSIENRIYGLNKASIMIHSIDKKSGWYKNCKSQRKRGAKICDSCPFKEYIEEGEKMSSVGHYTKFLKPIQLPRALSLVIDPIDRKSKWYKNCKAQRKRKAIICNSCPFRKYINFYESLEE